MGAVWILETNEIIGDMDIVICPASKTPPAFLPPTETEPACCMVLDSIFVGNKAMQRYSLMVSIIFCMAMDKAIKDGSLVVGEKDYNQKARKITDAATKKFRLDYKLFDSALEYDHYTSIAYMHPSSVSSLPRSTYKRFVKTNKEYNRRIKRTFK